MPDRTDLTPANRDDLVNALAFALRFDRSGKPHRLASTDMSRIAAEVLVEHLETAGFVVMRKPPVAAPPDPRFRHLK